ncbi:variable surface protein [Plasmodium gonderi]|uniref:Variable surface protein n=1 Tax=Plasmodium gonderi TaxID=77519 RepID=A0A1Y1JXZ1_PLAGO|nr:variable surface protein [Plasmodium gonderi]GAW84644.1 variable surface protein [Plasmodium gonderi]
MADDVYKFLKDFPFCEDTIQQFKNYPLRRSSYVCYAIANKFASNVNTNIILRVCPQILEYLYDLNIMSKNNIYREAGCRFIHYWLYYYLKKHNYSKYTVQIYEIIMLYYASTMNRTTFCTDYVNKLTDEQLEYLNYIYNFYKCIKNISKYNISENYTKYCGALKNIIEENQTPVLKEVCDTTQPQKSTLEESNIQEIACSCRSNIVATILATIIVMLIMLFFLLFFFKYTPYGPLLSRRIKRIRKMLDKNTNPRNISQRTEVPINILNSGIYDMLYN